VGFLPASDPRVQGTLRAIEHKLLIDGEFVLRYETENPADGLPEGEGAFFACSFWLIDNYILQGRHVEARQLFERLLSRCNDVGLLAEEFDPVALAHAWQFPASLQSCRLYQLRAQFEPAKRSDRGTLTVGIVGEHRYNVFAPTLPAAIERAQTLMCVTGKFEARWVDIRR
jgi:hypothetical protein